MTLQCPECKNDMVLRKGKFGSFYGCKGYPNCTVTAALHPDGTLMSTPCDVETKRLRQEAHKIAGEIWGNWESPRCKKGEMYSWLEHNSKSGHFGKMNKAELIEVIGKMKLTLEWKNV